MLPALQPSRPKHPQPPRPHHPSYTQTRTLHDPSSPAVNPPQPQNPAQQHGAAAPAMPTPPLLQPARGTPLYDAAIRHPVFFTSQLRKLPFPTPQGGSQGLSPVASGYVEERRREGGGMGTKL